MSPPSSMSNNKGIEIPAPLCLPPAFMLVASLGQDYWCPSRNSNPDTYGTCKSEGLALETARLRSTLTIIERCGNVGQRRSLFKLKNTVFWDVAACRSCVNRRFGQDLHAVTSQKTVCFIVTAVKTSNPALLKL
jgi:hypothetical protein